MKKEFWLFHDNLCGESALFETFEEADAFRRKIDIALINDPEIGEAYTKDEYWIKKVKLNPSFDEWY